MTSDEIKYMLDKHAKWLRAEEGVVQADLTEADLTGADLTGADLTGAKLMWAKLAGSKLAGAKLMSADLMGANLTGADLTGADLTGAKLAGAKLAGAKMMGAVGITAPIIPNIDAAILAAIGAGGTLDMGDWHRCATTHCRAGWAITLAGLPGEMLEDRIGPSAAGALIYAASRPDKPIPDFQASTEEAMDDMRACAGAKGD